MLTKQQVDKLAKPITNHAIIKWRAAGGTLILINAIGQKFIVPLPTEVPVQSPAILEAGPTPETAAQWHKPKPPLRKGA